MYIIYNNNNKINDSEENNVFKIAMRYIKQNNLSIICNIYTKLLNIYYYIN